jgi:hypothetical protein
MLDDPQRGLPASSAAFVEERYRPRLSADGLAQPFLSVGGDRFGLSVVGGGSFFWSDLLGDRRLAAALRVNGGPKDISGILAYENRSRRWTWGASLQQTTWRAGTASSALAEREGRAVALEQLVRFREWDRAATLRLAYPFERGRRFEVAGGYRHVSFAAESDVRAFAFDTGEPLMRERRGLPAPEALHLGELSAAFVKDDARFGPTSAVEGSRLRLELTPTLGTKSFAGLRLDYRKYWRLAPPLTVAGRLLHYGRYGRDADDARLAPLFAGGASLVRGYDNLGGARCRPGACARLDGLVGSRVLVANVELRAPAFFLLSRGYRAYGPIPTELVLFFDAATAWSDGSPALRAREWTRSWGVGLRVNLLGLAVGEIDYVRPLDRADRSSMFRMRMGAGF